LTRRLRTAVPTWLEFLQGVASRMLSARPCAIPTWCTGRSIPWNLALGDHPDLARDSSRSAGAWRTGGRRTAPGRV